MSLKTKLFCFLVLTPVLAIGYFLFLVSSTFVATQTAGIFENQIQLLNSVHLLLSKIDSRDLGTSTKHLFDQEGLHSLIITDTAGKIRYSGDSKLLGKTIAETLGERVQKNVQEQTSEEGSFEAANLKNEKILVSFFKFELVDSRFFMLLTKSKATATRAALLFIFKSIGAVVAVLALFVFFTRMIHGTLTAGIEQLIKAMETLGQGNWLTPVPAAGTDEVGVLAKSFTSMRKQLHAFLKEDQKNTRLEAQSEFSTTIRNLFLSKNEHRTEALQLAAVLETNPAGGTFWHHCEKNSAKGRYFLFLLAEAPRGEALASLSAICRWALEADPQMTDTQACVQNLNSLIGVTFGKSVAWNYCLCSLNMTTGELDWITLSHTTPTPLIITVDSKSSQPGTEGRVTLKKGDFVLLHSQSTKPKTLEQTSLHENTAAKELLSILAPPPLPDENIKNLNPPISIDQSYIVVKWENPL